MCNRLLGAFLLILPLAAFAQTTVQRRPLIRSIGEGVVAVRPDQAKATFAVVTEAATAAEAAAANATQTTSLIEALRAVLGPNAEIRTTSYSLSPKYVYPRDGGTPTLTGFTAQNMLDAVIGDLTKIGGTIDAGIRGGANRVDSFQLMLKDDSAARAQALKAAGQKARADAEAIASGLGVRVGAVLAAEEGYGIRPLTTDVKSLAATAAQTPIETGSLEVRATVTVEFELQ